MVFGGAPFSTWMESCDAAVFPQGCTGLVHGGLSTRKGLLSQGVWAQKARVASFLDWKALWLLFLLVAQTVRICLQCRRPRFDPWVRKIPWRRKWQPTPVFWPGESHGQRSLAGYSPQDHKESDMTEWRTCSPFYLLTPSPVWNESIIWENLGQSALTNVHANINGS